MDPLVLKLDPRTVVLFCWGGDAFPHTPVCLQSVSLGSDGHGNGKQEQVPSTGSGGWMGDGMMEGWMEGGYSADMEPVVWVRRGTFGYINKHSSSAGYQTSPQH